MAPVKITDDYYAILEVSSTADEDAVKSSYRRLARVRHPDKNTTNPHATAEFQLLQAAYSTLIDAAQRRTYDILHYPSIRSKSQTKSSAGTSHPTSWTSNAAGTTDAYRAEAERYRQQVQALDKTIQDLQKQRNQEYDRRAETASGLNVCQAALDRIWEETEKESREEAARNTWFGYLFRPGETQEQKEARERSANERRTGQIVLEAKHGRLKTREEEIQTRISQLTQRIMQTQQSRFAAVQNEISAKEKLRVALQREAERARRRAEEAAAAKRQQEMKRKQQEEANRRKEEEKNRQEAWTECQERFERQRREEAAERARQKLRQRAQAAERAAEEVLRKAEEQRKERETGKRAAADQSGKEMRDNHGDRGGRVRGTGRGGGTGGGRGRGRGTSSTAGQSTGRSDADVKVCQHKGWWQQTPGSLTCQKCECPTPRFAFRCPDCEITTCVSCRDTLKGKKNRNKPHQGSA